MEKLCRWGNLINTRLIALTTTFAALYFILSIYMPGIPVIGFPGITIELEASIASVFGMILGPYAGALAAFLGTIIAFLYRGSSFFDLPFIFSPALNAIVVGLIFKNRSKIAFTLLALVIVAFWFTPLVNPVLDYWYIGLAATFDKIIALLLMVPVARMLPTRVVRGSEKAELRSLGVSFGLILLVSFIGYQSDSALSCAIFAFPPVYELFGLNLDTMRALYVVSPFAYVIIGLIQALIAASIGLPLIRALKSRGWI